MKYLTAISLLMLGLGYFTNVSAHSPNRPACPAVINCASSPGSRNVTADIQLDANGNPIAVNVTGGRGTSGGIETCPGDKVTFSIPAQPTHEFAILFGSGDFPGSTAGGRNAHTWSTPITGPGSNHSLTIVSRGKSGANRECSKYSVHLPNHTTLDPVWILN